MSLLLNHIQTHPHETKRLIGITFDQFNTLVKQAELIEIRLNQSKETHKIRINRRGAGSPKKLSTSDQILLTIDYLRQFETFQSLGIKFEVSESTAHNIFHKWLPILKELLPASLLSQVKDYPGDLEWVQEILTEYELIVDSSVQPIQRPESKQEQEKLFDGYRHLHGIKNQLIVLPKGEDIVDVNLGEPAPKSDIKIFRENQNNLAKSQKFIGDNGYQGESQIKTPPHKYKELKSGKLTPEEKKENQVFSQQRIIVEHIIRFVKIFKIARERFRLRKNIYEQVLSAVCGLVRLRIGALILSS